MTGLVTDTSLQKMQRLAAELKTELDKLQPLLRQMHLLSSNAVSSAARAGSEGDAFRVLTQAMQQLRQDINNEVQQAQLVLTKLLQPQQSTALKPLLRQLETALAELPIAIRKGDYLATFSSVEAAHGDIHGANFDSVATMLKQLIANLRKQVATQQDKLTELLELS